jgi:hypothetical protein
METIYSYINATKLSLIMGSLLVLGPSAFTQSQPISPMDNPLVAELLSTNLPPPGFGTRWDYTKSFTNRTDIENAYRAGNISEGEAMLAETINKISPNDKSPVDTYGKVIDQDGQPVSGAKIRGCLEFEEKEIKEEHDTKTDGQGQFHFLGLIAKDLVAVPEKEGYEYDLMHPVLRPKNYLPDPNNPLVYTMWKLRGPEPMKHIQIYSQVPRDGSSKRFDLLSNVQRNTGNLVVALTRNPLTLNQSNRLKPFNWSVTFEITNGGFQEITNIYPNEAPLEGYQPTLTWSFPTNAVAWQSNFKHNYYFKSQGGQVYGRITLEVWAGGMTELAPFNADIYANPGGSRNLEFDPKKQIQK